jgi:hypothetical protein
MAAKNKRSRWARLMCWGFGLATAGAAWSAAGWANAQTGPLPTIAEQQLPAKSYMNKTTFYLPVSIDDRTRAGLQEIQLYVKQDPSQPWMMREKIAPNQNCFSFKAAQDGEYWFTVVTVDKAGRMTPSDFSHEAPGVIVVLDSQPPQVDVSALPPSAEGAMVKVDVRDPHLDPSQTQFYFQTGDKMWRQISPMADHPDQFCIPRQAVLTGMIKIVAVDMAKNVATRELSLSSLPPAGGVPLASAPAPTAAATQPKTDPGTISPIPKIDDRAMAPVSGSMQALPPSVAKTAAPLPGVVDPKTDKGTYVINPNPVRPVDVRGADVTPAVKNASLPSPFPSIPETPATVTPPTAVSVPATPVVTRTQEASTINKQIVNNTHVVLDYQIEQMGASGVGKVEIWITLDQGRTWQKHCEDADRKSPAEVDLPGEGLYGLSLVVTNGRGFGGTPPSPGDTPDWWIEVDLTRPLAELLHVRPGAADEAGALHIAWNARDKNLGVAPVDLFHAPKKDGPWTPIAKGLRNDGHYRWTVPGDLGAHAYIRMMVTDQAGNVAQCETAQPIPLDDLSRPRGRVVGISTGAPRVTLVPQN